jgi:type III secretion system FlhB-like substrate exporter
LIKSCHQSKLNLVFTEIGNSVASSRAVIIFKAMHSFIIKLDQCPLLTTFFAGHHIFTSIPEILYLSLAIILAAFANISGFFQKICIIKGSSIFSCGKTASAKNFDITSQSEE